MFISFPFSSWGCYTGPIWDPSGQPRYGLTHMGPIPNPVALPIWVPCLLGGALKVFTILQRNVSVVFII